MSAREQLGDPTMERLQDRIRRLEVAVAALLRHPLAQGVLLHTEANQPDYTGIEFAAGVPKIVKHGLGREPKGWFEINIVTPGPADFHCGLFPSPYPANVSSLTHLSIDASADGHCFLFVF